MFVIFIHPISRRFVRANIPGATCSRDVGNFIKRPALCSLPFIYGNPFLMRPGDLKLRSILRFARPQEATGGGKPFAS